MKYIRDFIGINRLSVGNAGYAILFIRDISYYTSIICVSKAENIVNFETLLPYVTVQTNAFVDSGIAGNFVRRSKVCHKCRQADIYIHGENGDLNYDQI